MGVELEMEILNYNPLTMINLNFKPSCGLIGSNNEWFEYDDNWIKELDCSLTMINFSDDKSDLIYISKSGLKSFGDKHNFLRIINYSLPKLNNFSCKSDLLNLFKPLKNMFHLQKVYIFKTNPLVDILKVLFKDDLIIINPPTNNQFLEIKKSLNTGNLITYQKMVGDNYDFSGEVVPKRQLAREMGYPTANLMFLQPLPIRYGVYLVQVHLPNDDKTYWGMSDYYEQDKQGKKYWFETHIFDFDKDIYGWNINVKLISFERDNIKFKNLIDLNKQLEKDYQNLKNKIK